MKRMEKVNKLLDIMEQKYPEIYKHSERVAMMCYEFGKKFDIDSVDRETLYIAGFLHEVGKCNFDKEIKIGKDIVSLDNVYPLFSKAVICNLGDYDRIADIVSQHMENLDGSGYPSGLNVNNIHLYAIMLHLCDFYDSRRMNGDSHNSAIAKIRKQTDIMFPKKMITPFIKMLITDELDLW